MEDGEGMGWWGRMLGEEWRGWMDGEGMGVKVGEEWGGGR